MGRPKKEIISETVENTDTSELKKLQEQVLMLSKQLEGLLNNKQSIEQKDHQEGGLFDFDELDESNKIKISSDDYIKVISLAPMYLTLTTQKKGGGIPFNFEKFGEVKRILYHDLVNIMENHRNFLEQGYFYILNRDVIRKHGLDEFYSKILTKEKIEKILAGNLSDAVNMFKTANKSQQELIAMMIVDDLVKGKDIDLNFVDRISRIVGFNLHNSAEEMIELIKIKTQKEE
jgi:hypothetical protein